MTKNKKCPLVRDGKGKPADCGDWCAWFSPARDERFSACSIRRFAAEITNLGFVMRRRFNPPPPRDTDVPF